MAFRRSQSKYHAVRTEYAGVLFASKREAARYQLLLLRGQLGEIADLELQPSFPIVVNGVTVCTYRADFKFYDLRTGQWTVEDAKGMRTPVYKLKKKLVEAQHGIEVHEV